MYLSQTLFKLTAVVTTVFVITILAMVAMLVGDPDAPVNLWFNRNGATVMTVEVIAIGLFGMSAMIADRNETVREELKKRDQEK
jgi:succinate dehydrogenase hydrophobic anchor subunit